MKTLLTLALTLAFVATGSVSWASTNPHSLAGRLVFGNSLASAKGAATRTELDKLSNGANPAAQTITICKKTLPTGGTGFPFSWANGFGALPSFR